MHIARGKSSGLFAIVFLPGRLGVVLIKYCSNIYVLYLAQKEKRNLSHYVTELLKLNEFLCVCCIFVVLDGRIKIIKKFVDGK